MFLNGEARVKSTNFVLGLKKPSKSVATEPPNPKVYAFQRVFLIYG